VKFPSAEGWHEVPGWSEKVKLMLDIKAYEAMAMLDLPDGERMELAQRMDDLTGGFAALEQIDTEGVMPLVSVLELHSVLREDVPGKLLIREEILSNAPEQYDGYFQVPGTLE